MTAWPGKCVATKTLKRGKERKEQRKTGKAERGTREYDSVGRALVPQV